MEAREWAKEQMPQMRADDGLHILPGAPAEHGFEEAGRLGDFPVGLLDLAVGGLDADVAVALDAGDVMDVDVYGFWHCRASSLLKSSMRPRRSLTVLPYFCMMSRAPLTLGSSTRPRQP